MLKTISFPNLLSQKEYKGLSDIEKNIHAKEILRQTLAKNPGGATITQLNELPFDRQTIEKHLDVMKRTNEVHVVKLGLNKIYITNYRRMSKATDRAEKLDNREYQVYRLHDRHGDFAIIWQRDLDRDGQDITGGLQIPLKHLDEFVEFLDGLDVCDWQK